LKSLEDSLRHKAHDNSRYPSGLEMQEWNRYDLDDSSADL